MSGFSNRSGANGLTREAMERFSADVMAEAGKPLGMPNVDIIARAVASWSQVRYLCVALDVGQAIARLPNDDASSLAFAAGVEVLVVPEMPSGFVMPVDREMRPVSPPGGWQEAFDLLRKGRS